jgi:hypothetical protein
MFLCEENIYNDTKTALADGATTERVGVGGGVKLKIATPHEVRSFRECLDI